MAKYKKSDITKRYINLSRLFHAISIIILIAPILVYVVLGFANGEITQKVTLGITLSIALLLTIVNAIFKFHIRSVIWIMVLGIYFCLQNIMPLLLIVAVGTILDEFILTPLHKSYKNKATINKEIDKRIT